MLIISSIVAVWSWRSSQCLCSCFIFFALLVTRTLPHTPGRTQRTPELHYSLKQESSVQAAKGAIPIVCCPPVLPVPQTTHAAFWSTQYTTPRPITDTPCITLCHLPSQYTRIGHTRVVSNFGLVLSHGVA